jgi:putative transposase
MSAKLAFIVAHASEHAIRFMCRVLGIARSWFHAWQRAAPKRAERTARRDRLGAEIREIFAESKGRYGAPRIHAELQDRGSRISKRTVAKLMQEKGIRPPRGKRRAPITTDSRHAHAVAPNLLCGSAWKNGSGALSVQVRQPFHLVARRRARRRSSLARPYI